MKINRNEFINKLNDLKGKKFNELSESNNYHVKDKGSLGKYIESEYFGKELDNKSEPDFILVDVSDEESVELKVTPVKKLKNGKYSAKERLVLNMIDYVKEVDKDFYEASFLKKCESMALVFYKYEEDKDIMDFDILRTTMHKFSEEDLIVIKRDYDIIMKKIKEGKAHELSEGDTEYLGACTKGAGKGKGMKDQPNSDIKAKGRAFSLKTKYMTYYFNSLNYEFESIFNKEQLKEKTIIELIKETFNPYVGKSIKEIAIDNNLEYKESKDIKGQNKDIIKKILKVKDFNKIEELEKSNTVIRTLVLKDNRKIKEHIKLTQLTLDELMNGTFEDSTVYERLTQRVIFVIFSFEGGKYIFEGVKDFILTAQELKEYELVWEETKIVVERGVEITKENGNYTNDFPKPTSGFIGHIRPSAQKGYNPEDISTISNSMQLPDGQRITKQAFWLNKDFVENKLSK